jgi:hypothetical protein
MPNINRFDNLDMEEYKGAKGTGFGKSLPWYELEDYAPWNEKEMHMPGSPESHLKNPKMRGFLKEIWPTMRTYQPTGRTNFSIERNINPDQRMAIMELLRILGAI